MEKNDKIIFVAIIAVFLIFYFMPPITLDFNSSVVGGLNLLGEYAKQHILS